MVIIYQPTGGFELDFLKLSNDKNYYKIIHTNKNKKLEIKKKKLTSLDISLIPKLRAIALEKEDYEHIVRFGKFRGVHYNDLLSEGMDKYIKFLKKCPFRNIHIEHFLKWVEDHEKENNETET